ncbi:hypothetical protein ACN6QF_21005, partial [Acinetobacter baumannii]
KYDMKKSDTIPNKNIMNVLDFFATTYTNILVTMAHMNFGKVSEENVSPNSFAAVKKRGSLTKSDKFEPKSLNKFPDISA